MGITLRLCNVLCDFQNLENILCKRDNIVPSVGLQLSFELDASTRVLIMGDKKAEKDIIVDFIEVYRGLPAVWDVKYKKL